MGLNKGRCDVCGRIMMVSDKDIDDKGKRLSTRRLLCSHKKCVKAREQK